MERHKERISFNEVRPYVEDCKYPCSNQELISCAREHQAPSEVIKTLEVIGPQTQYTGLIDVKQNVERFQK